MTALAEPEVLTYEISGRLPVGYLTAADFPYIELDVPFEIEDGALGTISPPTRSGTIWSLSTPALAKTSR